VQVWRTAGRAIDRPGRGSPPGRDYPLAPASAIGYHCCKINRRGDGAAMKVLIALFALTVLAAATTSLGMVFWTGRVGHHDTAMRAIHYDTNAESSTQHRIPAD